MSKHAPPVVFTGGATVIASGTVIAFNEWGEVSFRIGPLNERLTVVFKFEDGPVVGPQSRIEVLPQDSRTIKLVLRNFGNPTGDGTISPFKLGTLEGLALYVHFRIVRVGKSPRTIHYTFYQRDDAITAKAQLEALKSLDTFDE